MTSTRSAAPQNASRAIVLSVTPLAERTRETLRGLLGEDVELLQLSTLRHKSIPALLGALRSMRASRVVATDRAFEYRLFRDFLVLIALVIPTSRREFLCPDGEWKAIRLHHAIPAAGRIAMGMAAGQWSLGASRWHMLRSGSRSRQPLPRMASRRKCLYLKPVLMYGIPSGGSVGHVAGVVNALLRRGTEVRLLSSVEQPSIEAAARQTVVSPAGLVAFPSELNQLHFHRKFYARAEREVLEFRPDFLYARYCLDDLTVPRLRRKYDLPVVLEFNGSEVWVQKHWGRPLRYQSLAERIERICLQSADLVVAVSEEVRKQALAAGVAAERILFYPNCIDPLIFDPQKHNLAAATIRKEFGIPEDADLFTFVGTFGLWHGTAVLAEAIRRLIDESSDWLRQRNVHFLFVGDGKEADRVRSALGPERGRPFVTMVGLQPQEKAPEFLAASDVLVSPHVPNPDGSPFFGSPTKLFEYMSMGKLIVASDLDQIGHVLRGWKPGDALPSSAKQSDSGLLVEPGSVVDLIRGIREAASMSPSERLARGRRARSHVLSAFVWERNVDSVLETLNRVLVDRRTSPASGAGRAGREGRGGRE